jgi:hypothetical protein
MLCAGRPGLKVGATGKQFINRELTANFSEKAIDNSDDAL